LLAWEVNNAQVINRYDVLMPCLHRQDVLFVDSQESKTPSTSSNKRPATEAVIQVAEVVWGHKKGRKVDNRPLCSFCSKPGHLIDACLLNHSEKKKDFHSRGRGPPGAVLPLNNITTSSLHAMISQAVDSLCDSSSILIHSSIPSTLATLSPYNSTDKASQFVSHSRAYHDFSDLSYIKKNKLWNHYAF